MVSSSSWRPAGTGSTARGYGYKWQQYRIRYLTQHPLCVKCKGLNLITAATVVDHVIPHQGDMQRFWDEANHQALCKPCHDVVKAGEEREAGLRKGGGIERDRKSVV